MSNAAWTWFNGFEAPDVPVWGSSYIEGQLLLFANTYRIGSPAYTRVTVWTSDISFIGKTAILTITNPAIVGVDSYEAVMEPDSVSGCSALFVIVGLSLGIADLDAEIIE